MPRVEKKTFDRPDEVKTPPKARIELVNLGGSEVMRATFEPGWKWSESIKPIAGTESCEVHHCGHVLSGRLVTRMNDGTVVETGPGEVVDIPPGHDAWVEGNEAVVFIDFGGATQVAKILEREPAASI